MEQFQVWLSGYAATGDRGTASFLGTFEGETFRDAVYKYVETLSEESKADFKDNDYGLRLGWGKFYDNEKDARKIFG